LGTSRNLAEAFVLITAVKTCLNKLLNDVDIGIIVCYRLSRLKSEVYIYIYMLIGFNQIFAQE